MRPTHRAHSSNWRRVWRSRSPSEGAVRSKSAPSPLPASPRSSRIRKRTILGEAGDSLIFSISRRSCQSASGRSNRSLDAGGGSSPLGRRAAAGQTRLRLPGPTAPPRRCRRGVRAARSYLSHGTRRLRDLTARAVERSFAEPETARGRTRRTTRGVRVLARASQPREWLRGGKSRRDCGRPGHRLLWRSRPACGAASPPPGQRHTSASC